MKIKIRIPKSRNPLVAHAMFRKAGVHRKSHKALRRKSKSSGYEGC